MLTIKEIREDLKEVRYYYSKQKTFDSASKTIFSNAVVVKVNKYNLALKDAPPRLYDLYVCLYIQNNTQETVAYDWDRTSDYIKRLNLKLCEYLQKVLI